MRGTRILISGASIAGPALAFWLHRFGAEVTVVERAPELRPGGQAVDLRGVAKTVVRRMGLDDEVRAALTDTRGMSAVNARGRTLATMRADQFGGDGLIAEYEIARGDLSQVFYDATKDDTEYVFGDRITALDEREDGVHVTFEHGEPRRFDVVVGADGLHSGVRALVWGPEERYLHHMGSYLSFWSTDNHLGVENWSLGYAEVNRSVGFRTKNGNSSATAYFSFDSPKLDYDFRDIEAQKDIVRRHLRGMGWEAPKLLAQLDDAPDFYFDSCSQVLLDSWTRGRIALFGDAAFCASPVSGQGTSMAVVGAYILAGELAAAGGDHAAGLRAYERRMRDWVLVTQKMGRANAGTLQPKSKFALRARIVGMRLLPYLPQSLLLRGFDKVINGIEVPDYGNLLVETGS